jgi:hypothetical protein
LWKHRGGDESASDVSGRILLFYWRNRSWLDPLAHRNVGSRLPAIASGSDFQSRVLDRFLNGRTALKRLENLWYYYEGRSVLRRQITLLKSLPAAI